MFKLNEDYYFRKCFFKSEQVPTQSVMMKKMTPALANVYFKSMTPKLKVLAGLEPSLKGGGSDWFVPPRELLARRAILKPTKKKYLLRLGHLGIDSMGEKLVKEHHRCLEEEKKKAVLENDIMWKEIIVTRCQKYWNTVSKEAATMNTTKIKCAFEEFQVLYATSLNKIESLLHDAAIKEIERIRDDTFTEMKNHYETILKIQATRLYDEYKAKLENEKAEIKGKFIKDLEEARIDTVHKIHDIKLEKHTTIEKLRNLLQCQNLACQMYVALKEKEECKKETEKNTHDHQIKIQKLKETLARKNIELRLAYEKEKNRKEFNRIWQMKVCHVVKKFQIFVAYCLQSLPEYAEFFTNVEKLLLLQLNDAMEEPSTESLFEFVEEKFHTPIPRPHPMVLFCDKGYKPQIDQKLCPKHCTSSSSQLPVIVINKRCIYAACDNFSCFTNKIEQFIEGQRGDDMDLYDDRDYSYDVPVKYTSEQQLLELKLESSLMQILQQELPNVKAVSTECCVCKVPHCFCSRLEAVEIPSKTKIEKKNVSPKSVDSGNKIDNRNDELKHKREPKWESYINYITPTSCTCAKRAMKTLKEHLPPYMRNMSEYESPDLLNYEPCTLKELKLLVDKARGKRPPFPKPVAVKVNSRAVGTQYSDQELERICMCFSDDELERFYQELGKLDEVDVKQNKFKIVDAEVSPINFERHASSFATERAFSLRNLLNGSLELTEIFTKKDCSFQE